MLKYILLIKFRQQNIIKDSHLYKICLVTMAIILLTIISTLDLLINQPIYFLIISMMLSRYNKDMLLLKLNDKEKHHFLYNNNVYGRYFSCVVVIINPLIVLYLLYLPIHLLFSNFILLSLLIILYVAIIYYNIYKGYNKEKDILFNMILLILLGICLFVHINVLIFFIILLLMLFISYYTNLSNNTIKSSKEYKSRAINPFNIYIKIPSLYLLRTDQVTNVFIMVLLIAVVFITSKINQSLDTYLTVSLFVLVLELELLREFSVKENKQSNHLISLSIVNDKMKTYYFYSQFYIIFFKMNVIFLIVNICALQVRDFVYVTYNILVHVSLTLIISFVYYCLEVNFIKTKQTSYNFIILFLVTCFISLCLFISKYVSQV